MKSCCVGGIDPGLDGGIAFFGVYGPFPAVGIYPMPTRPGPKGGREINVSVLRELLRPVVQAAKTGTVLMAVELVHSMPNQGIVGAFTFGKGYGTVLTVLELLGIPIQHVTPQAWKKAILTGLGTDKSAAIRWCQSRFPKTRFLATERSTKPHDGMCDATCLAEYARLTVLGKQR